MPNSENSEFLLIEKTQEKLEMVAKILKTRLPRSALSFNVLKLMEHGIIKEPAHKVNIYAFEAELNSMHTAFLCLQLDFEYPKTVLTSAPDHVTKDMVEAFRDAMTKIWKEMLWYEVEKTLWLQLEECFRERKPTIVDDTSFVAIFPDEAVNAATCREEVPENKEYELKPLQLADAHVVDQHWFPNGPPEKLIFIQDGINLVTSAGIFMNGEESPVSYAIASLMGSINCLHTMDSHRRKGFAVAVMRAIQKHLKGLNLIPCAHIVEGNSQSQRLFNKLGFVSVSENNFIGFNVQIHGNSDTMEVAAAINDVDT